MLFFPITSKQPEPSRFSVEIPDIEKRRAGLDADRRLWIILDEFNSDRIGRSFYLEPEPPLGHFSKAFFLPLLREFIARRKASTEVVAAGRVVALVAAAALCPGKRLECARRLVLAVECLHHGSLDRSDPVPTADEG